uniref:Tify domain-containing protein n=1 Tax=Davidia involucrata TaxID=16924 RepID=A0A5B7BE00_DAVIN
MSFQNKGFWMAKGGGHLTDGDTAFDNPSRNEPKRSHQWFAETAEPELFPNKKQAVQVPNSKSTPGIFTANASWENASSFQSEPIQFVDRLFVSDTTRPVNFTERNVSPIGIDSLNMRKRGINEKFGNDSSVGLSISPTMEDPVTCLNYGGIRKVKVNQVKDSDNGLHEPKEHYSSMGQVYNSGNETTFMSMGQAYNKEVESVMLMGHTYNRSIGSTPEKGDDNTISIGHTYNKGETNTISFGGFHDEPDIDTLARPINSYELLYDHSSVQTLETPSKKELDLSNANVVVSASQVAKSRPESVSKNKSELKTARKEAPNSFPSNVKSLISTGMLDGVPVKYVCVSREELRGIIKGSGYLCGCQACNYSKALNAYEFERHAGSKTKHPNNHIYFENGKTIYQIVQELRSTPESLLFDAIQTVTGSPINQKSFRTWKESFQAATRELQRIYGKEELNL